MRCIKVDIKRELVDVDPSHLPYRVSIRKQMDTEFRETGNVSNVSDVKNEVYFPRRVFNHDGEREEIYLVRMEENQLFTDLMKVTQSTVDDQIKKAVNTYETSIIPYIKFGMLKGFKRLPWYKRLFFNVNDYKSTI